MYWLSPRQASLSDSEPCHGDLVELHCSYSLFLDASFLPASEQKEDSQLGRPQEQSSVQYPGVSVQSRTLSKVLPTGPTTYPAPRTFDKA